MKTISLLILSSLIFPSCTPFLLKKEQKNLPSLFIEKSFLSESDSPQEIEEQLKFITSKYSNQAIEWWILYKTAMVTRKKNPKILCENMNFLSKIQEFPLRPYAHLHLYSNCHSDQEMNLEEFPDWLKKRAALEWLKKARKSKNIPSIMESSYQLYELSEQKDTREQYLLSAIKRAREVNDPRLKKWLKKLYKLSPRYIPKPQHSQKLSVAHDFRRERFFKKAATYYRQLLNSNKSNFREKNESFKWMRWIYKEQGNHGKSLIATRQWKNWLKRKMKDTPQAIYSYHNIFVLLARSQWTLNKTKEALQSLNQLEKEINKRISLFTIYRLKALIFDEQNKLNKSIDYFQKALNESAPDTEIEEQTKWNYSWALMKANQQEQSITILTDLLNSTKSQYLPSRINFWLGQIYESMENKEKSVEAYKEIIRTDPFSYYGLLAHYKTGRNIQIANIEFTPEPDENDEYLIAYWLIAIGDYKSTLDFLNFKSKEFRQNGNSNKTMSRSFLYYMSKAKSYLPLFRMVGNLPLEDRTRFFQSYTHLLFPIMYKDEVLKAEQLFNMEKELIFAVIRQESAYNPRARSLADAFGLMQVRPATARSAARKSGINYRRARDLYNPETNILIGTAFLKQIFKRYNFQFIVSLAAYNAGPTAVNRWIAKRKAPDSLSFVEEIPYEETRTYVRLLIRNFVLYKLLHSREKSIPFPEWVLQMNTSL